MSDSPAETGGGIAPVDPPSADSRIDPGVVFQADTGAPDASKRPVLLSASYYQGAFPPPEVLKQLERLIPGSAARIFGDYIKQSDHRRDNESKVVAANIEARKLGMYLGAGLSAMVILSGTLIALIRDAYSGAGVIGAGAALLATSYLKALGDQRKELAGKRQAMEDLKTGGAKPPVL